MPATLHVAVGADITHMHPSQDGAALGLAAFRDFQVFSEVISGLDDGGLYVNLGSPSCCRKCFSKPSTLRTMMVEFPESAADMAIDPRRVHT